MADISADRRPSAFSIWLRTGRWPGAGKVIEVKFNGWHDPKDGRFCPVGSGRYYGRGGWMGGGFTGGGGGSTGGGGASGSWEAPARPAPPKRTKPAVPKAAAQRPAPSRPVVPKPPQSPSRAIVVVAPAPPSTGEKLRSIIRNSYEFQIDALERTRYTMGAPTLTSAPKRSAKAQANAGGADRRPDDDGGHYIAARFNGPTDAFNHFAQNRNFNRSGYAKLENEWAKAIKAKQSVYVKIESIYKGGSKRPDVVDVTYWIDGARKYERFSNRKRR